MPRVITPAAATRASNFDILLPPNASAGVRSPAPSGSSLHRIINGPVGSVQPAFAGSSYDLPPAAGVPPAAAETPAFAALSRRRLERDPTVGPQRSPVSLRSENPRAG